MFHRRANILAIRTMRRPRTTVFSPLMKNYFGTGGAKEHQLKSCMPKMAAQADSLGFVLESHNIFRVMLFCGSRRSHSWAEYLGSVEQGPAIKWSLKVWMDLSAAFRRWICGVKLWQEIFFLRRVFLKISQASLSIILELGVVSISCDFIKEFLESFVDECA